MSTLHALAAVIGYTWLACLALSLLGFATAWLFAPRSYGCRDCSHRIFADDRKCTTCREAEAAFGYGEPQTGRQVITPVYLESKAASVAIRTV
jgi:hypothetical protein